MTTKPWGPYLAALAILTACGPGSLEPTGSDGTAQAGDVGVGDGTLGADASADGAADEPDAIDAAPDADTRDEGDAAVATPLLKTPTGQRWPDSPFLGTGLCCAQPLVQELFLVGHHPVPSGARLLRRG